MAEWTVCQAASWATSRRTLVWNPQLWTEMFKGCFHSHFHWGWLLPMMLIVDLVFPCKTDCWGSGVCGIRKALHLTTHSQHFSFPLQLPLPHWSVSQGKLQHRMPPLVTINSNKNDCDSSPQSLLSDLRQPTCCHKDHLSHQTLDELFKWSKN